MTGILRIITMLTMIIRQRSGMSAVQTVIMIKRQKKYAAIINRKNM